MRPFIGSPTKNVISVTSKAGGVRLGNGVHVALSRARSGLSDLGIGPEYLDATDPADAPMTVHADVVEHLGSDTTIKPQVEGIGPLIVHQQGPVTLASASV